MALKILDYDADDYSGHDDDRGLSFWTDQPYVAKTTRIGQEQRLEEFRSRLRQRMPPLFFEPAKLIAPPSGPVAIDFETDDPTLSTSGSAWAYQGQGAAIGLSCAWGGFSAYYGLGHRGGNVDDVGAVWRWLSDLFDRDDVIVVGANLSYDLGWAVRTLNKYPKRCADVQFMAALIDEYRQSYALDALLRTHLPGHAKHDGKLRQIAEDHGGTLTMLKASLKHLHTSDVDDYGAGDSRETWDLYAALLPQLAAQGLMPVHQLESDLIPMTTEMRRRGVKVDVGQAKDLETKLLMEMEVLTADLKAETGVSVEPWEGESCAAALRHDGLDFGLTASGAPRVQAEDLKFAAKNGSRVAAHIAELRKISKVITTFLRGHVCEHAVEGRIHASFNQLRSEREEGGGWGTVTGRFSSNAPNLQQLPSRDKRWGPLVRGLFYPDDALFASLDYKSQEPRLAVHFAARANVPGSAAAIAAYRANPDLDYHQYVADICGIPRGEAKTLNLGLAYGMGGAKLARSLGLPTIWMIPKVWKEVPPGTPGAVECAGPEARAIITKWERGAPFLRGLFKACEKTAKERGYILTLLRRRCRFDAGQYTHKSMNSLCQSSAADQTKLGMRLLWQAGVVPQITLHDELLFSVPNARAGDDLAQYMIEAATLLVPTLVDCKLGRNWGAIPK